MLCKSCRFRGYQPQVNNNKLYKICQGKIRIKFKIRSNAATSVLLLGALIIENARGRRSSAKKRVCRVALSTGRRCGAFSCAQKWRDTQQQKRGAAARGTEKPSVNFGGAPEAPLACGRRVFPACRRHIWRFWRIRLNQGIIRAFPGRSRRAPFLSADIGRATNAARILHKQKCAFLGCRAYSFSSPPR